MSGYPTETFETQSYGLGLPNPYPFGVPEGLPLSATTPALTASLAVFIGQGRLLGISVSNTKTSAQFIQVFDASSLPADNAVPLISVDIATVIAKAIAFDPYGRWFEQGCFVCNSSTQGTKTLGSADCLFDAQYIPQVI